MITAFDKFNLTFFKSSLKKIKWFDKKGILKIKPGLLAEINLDTCDVHDEYGKYTVTIINTKLGQIATVDFKFKSYLTTRIDNRHDYKCDGFKIVGHCGIDWYIAIPDPKEIENMVEIILEYISYYDV